MKKIIFTLLTFLVSTGSFAYDESYENINGIYYKLTKQGRTAVVIKHDSEYSGVISIPETVTYEGYTYTVRSIDKDAFAYCEGITSVSLPNTLETIGEFSFEGCTGLKSVTIPNSVKRIEEYAFVACESLETCQLSSSLVFLGKGAFRLCNKLKSITIPRSLTNIGSAAFSECGSLTSIFVESGNTVYDSRNNCNAIVETETSTILRGCVNTKLPNDIKKIGYYSFSGSNISSISLPSSTITIEAYAFHHCMNLKNVVIPAQVESIKNRAFDGCNNLEELHVHCLIPPTCGDYCFNYEEEGDYDNWDFIYKNCKLYVPKGCKGVYESADPWYEFMSIIEEESSNIYMPSAINKGYQAIKHINNKTVVIEKDGKKYDISGTTFIEK